MSHVWPPPGTATYFRTGAIPGRSVHLFYCTSVYPPIAGSPRGGEYTYRRTMLVTWGGAGRHLCYVTTTSFLLQDFCAYRSRLYFAIAPAKASASANCADTATVRKT